VDDALAEPMPTSSLGGGGAAAGLIHQGARKLVVPTNNYLDVGGSLHGSTKAMRTLSLASSPFRASLPCIRRAPHALVQLAYERELAFCSPANRAVSEAQQHQGIIMRLPLLTRRTWRMHCDCRHTQRGLIAALGCDSEQGSAQYA
jgi:hypothetical protein